MPTTSATSCGNVRKMRDLTATKIWADVLCNVAQSNGTQPISDFSPPAGFSTIPPSPPPMGGPSQSSVGAHGSQGSSAIQQWHPGVYTTLANLPSEFTVDFGQSRLITAFSTHTNRSHLPATAQRVNAFVDTMATLIVVNSVWWDRNQKR